MSLKFGDKVVVIKEGFFNGAKGVVKGYDTIDVKYEIQLEFNVTKSFYLDTLKKVTKKVKNVKIKKRKSRN